MLRRQPSLQHNATRMMCRPLPPKNQLRKMAASTSTWTANLSHLIRVIFLRPLRRQTTSEHCTTSPMLISHHGAAIASLARCPSLDTIKNADAEVPVLQFDYQFFSRDGQLVEEESRAATVLTATDTSSGWPLMVFVPEKGPNSYVIKAIVSWIKHLGYAKVTFQHDQESSLRSLAEQVQRESGHAHVHIQAAPRYSHASQDGVARAVDINHPVVSWLCRWCIRVGSVPCQHRQAHAIPHCDRPGVRSSNLAKSC